MTKFTLNGKAVVSQSPSDTPLLWVIRDELGLKGTKYGCGIAMCGACTVHLDGVATRSCVVPVSAASGREVTTIEGVAPQGKLDDLQQSLLNHGAVQCGYCTPG